MGMNEIKYRDISEVKTFEKYGDIFTQVRNNPETGWWLYKRVNKEDPTRIHYEVVKGHKQKLSGNKEVFTYPSTSEWGDKGFTIDNNKYAEAIINYLMERPTTTPEERHRFKMSLINASI